MNTTSISPAVPSAAGAIRVHRIRFVAKPQPGDDVLMEFCDSESAFAIVVASSADPLPAMPLDAEAAMDEFILASVPAHSSSELQHRAKEWMRRPEGRPAEPNVEIVLKVERVLWRPGRCVWFGAADRMDDVLKTITHFAYYERELRRLEQEIEADWATAQADVPLTHGVTHAATKRWPHVNDMTCRTTLRRMRFARLLPRLERIPASMPGPSRRIVSELTTQTDIERRLESVDDRIEIFEDLYELANDRISEYSYFSREYRLELWIIVLLVLEVAVMLAEVYAILGNNGN